MQRATGLALALGLAIAVGACQAAATTRTYTLTTLNDSGVGGEVSLTDIGAGRTRVEVRVDPAGNLDMPAHIHPGTCTDLVPQPRFPLENVRDGTSVTEVAATIAELGDGSFAVNLHRSPDDLETYTACADL